MKKNILSSLVLLFFVFAFSSCEEDRHLDWRYINQQWFESERLRTDENGEKFWQETESGLLFRVINPGIGDNIYQFRPSDRSMVEIFYTGRFFNNKEFDSNLELPSEKRTHHLADFARGFSEALRMMKRNAIYEVIIPYELAYGKEGMMGISGITGITGIPPYSALQFRIELINFWTE